MPANEIHQNDVGTIFKVTVKDGDDAVDISSATRYIDKQVGRELIRER